MKQGDRVKVYKDPFTKHKCEGEASLVKRDASVEKYGELEFWGVKFAGDSTTYWRWV